MAGGILPEASNSLRSYLAGVIKDATALTEHGRRSIVTLPDVLLALKRRGTTLYGYGDRHFLGTAHYDMWKPRRCPPPANSQDWKIRVEQRAAAAAVRAASAAPAETQAVTSTLISRAKNAAGNGPSEAEDAQAAAVATATLVSVRQQQIEEILGHVYGWRSESEMTLTHLFELVTTELGNRRLPTCSAAELERVLGAMEDLVVTAAHTANGVFYPPMVWLTC